MQKSCNQIGKPKTSDKFGANSYKYSSRSNSRPSMEKMIEVARDAEARRRAECKASPEIIPELPTRKTSETTKTIPAGNPSGDTVKTAQVLKKAAEAARAKKDPSDKTKRPIPQTKHSKRSHQLGPLTKSSHKKPTADSNTTSTRQSRALRVTEAMRHLKESAKNQEQNLPKRNQAQMRLEETLQQMNLNNPRSPLLLVALTHPSYTFENPNVNKENNQRLEFLGDAVLDFIVGEYLYLEFPEKSEGELTKIRAAVVNESTLAKAAQSIKLGNSLLLGRGEQVSGGRERPSILADALEALIGAFYLQEGFDAARQFVLDMLVPIIDQVNQDHYGDFKTLLQEVAQHDEQAVNYRVLEELGPDHDKSFTSGVFIQGVLKGKGTGKTKKEAEQLAAKIALENWEANQ
jgi:ribonuclease-3